MKTKLVLRDAVKGGCHSSLEVWKEADRRVEDARCDSDSVSRQTEDEVKSGGVQRRCDVNSVDVWCRKIRRYRKIWRGHGVKRIDIAASAILPSQSCLHLRISE